MGSGKGWWEGCFHSVEGPRKDWEVGSGKGWWKGYFPGLGGPQKDCFPCLEGYQKGSHRGCQISYRKYSAPYFSRFRFYSNVIQEMCRVHDSPSWHIYERKNKDLLSCFSLNEDII